MTPIHAADEQAMRQIGAKFAAAASAGDIVFLAGSLGAGKTTFVRGVLEGLGFDGPVRSPTFNLIQTFATHPPVMHADLYRLRTAVGLGIEDYFTDWLCFIEWPDRLGDAVNSADAWHIRIEFTESGRDVWIQPPFSAQA